MNTTQTERQIRHPSFEEAAKLLAGWIPSDGSTLDALIRHLQTPGFDHSLDVRMQFKLSDIDIEEVWFRITANTAGVDNWDTRNEGSPQLELMIEAVQKSGIEVK